MIDTIDSIELKIKLGKFSLCILSGIKKNLPMILYENEKPYYRHILVGIGIAFLGHDMTLI